jgi:hypothetical protein
MVDRAEGDAEKARKGVRPAFGGSTSLTILSQSKDGIFNLRP